MADDEPVYDRGMMAADHRAPGGRQIRSHRIPALPAVELPTADRATALAADTEAARGVAALLDWLGEGRALTQRGNLRKWREDELVAPVVGELTACSAGAMLMSVVEFYGQDTGVEEIRRWLAVNGDDPALLLEAISANPFRTSRSAMLGALVDAVGPHLLDLAEGDPRLAPTALMLGGLRGRIDLNELEGTAGERRRAVLGMAEQILEMLEHLGPEGLAESFGGLPADAREGMAAMIAESGHPDRWLVDLFAEEVAPVLLGPGTRRRASLAEARNRSKHVKRRRKPKRRR